MHRHHFFSHRGEHGERFGRHPWGGGHGRGHGGEFGGDLRGPGRGGRIGRFLEHGDLRFVVLALIAEQPRHGYELIKALEDRTGGAYRPSPGVIYPTLSLLEDEGFVAVAQAAGGRKLYEITEAGREAMVPQQGLVDRIFSRMDEAAEGSDVSRPRIERAVRNLMGALRARMTRGDVSPEQLDRIVALIDEAAQAIEKI
jgi:DNA-binding PadR family transcriptional regulator